MSILPSSSTIAFLITDGEAVCIAANVSAVVRDALAGYTVRPRSVTESHDGSIGVTRLANPSCSYGDARA